MYGEIERRIAGIVVVVVVVVVVVTIASTPTDISIHHPWNIFGVSRVQLKLGTNHIVYFDSYETFANFLVGYQEL
jgi:hypothetical protein